MNKLYLLIGSIICLFSASILNSCTEKGDQINDPDLAVMKFTTYTIDTLRLSVTLNGEKLTDSLITPQGVFIKEIEFLESNATLLIKNAVTGAIYIDSIITLLPGPQTISLVQFAPGIAPAIPLPPSEPGPVPGNYKCRFQYSAPSSETVPFLDSVLCVLRLTGTPVDTFILSKYQFSNYYEANIGSNFSMIIYDPVSLTVLDNTTNSLNSSNGFTSFNTARLYAASPTNYLLQRIY